MQAHCKERWVDVFVTKSDTLIDEQEYSFDDQFVCSVQSVRIDPVNPTHAVLVPTSSDWIMPTWSREYDGTSPTPYPDTSLYATYPYTKEQFKTFYDLQVGDLIRVGSTPTVGHTDYLTIVEKVEVDALYNATAVHPVFERHKNSSTGFVPDQVNVTTVNESGGIKIAEQAVTTIDQSGGMTIATNTIVDDASVFSVGDKIKIDDEIMTVLSVFTHINTITVTRGVDGTTVASHADGSIIFLLNVNSHIFTVADGTQVSVGDKIKIDDEIMSVTNISSNQLTVTRAQDGTAEAAHADGVNISVIYDTFITFTKGGIAHYALRLNHAIDCTNLPVNAVIDTQVTTPFQTDNTPATAAAASLANRNKATTPLTYASRSDEVNYFPMYTTKRYLSGTTLRASLDHGVKQVRCIKLVGYSLANKRQVGLQHSHEVHEDDYIILRINEIEGHVISNNRFANGAFAILYCGSTNDNEVGAKEYSRFDTVNGIVVKDVDATNSVLRNLTLEVTDRLGKAAHFGRLHLWFKLLVTHG